MASPSYAQLIAKDSTGVMAISLDEVTIQARSIIEKGDRKVILPTQNQLKMFNNSIIPQTIQVFPVITSCSILSSSF